MYDPNTEQILKDAGLKDDRNFPVIENLREFREKCKNANVEITSKVQAMYRLRHKDREYIFYHRELYGKDFIGNEISEFEPAVGQLEKPVIQWAINADDGKRVARGVSHWDTKYTIPFSKAKVDEILKENPSDNVAFYIKDGSLRFRVNYQTFISGTIDDITGRGRVDIAKAMNAENVPAAPVSSKA